MKTIRLLFAAALLACSPLLRAQVPLLVSSVRGAAGSAAAPTYTFSADTGTGLYRFSAGAVGMALSGTNQFIFGTDGTTVNSRLFGSGTGTGYLQITDTGNVGALALVAAGTNQSITLTPSGTGQTVLGGGKSDPVTWQNGAQRSGYLYSDVSQVGINNTANFGGEGVLLNTASHYVAFWVGGAEKARLATTTGNLLLGGLTTDGTGVLQLPTATTSAGGITFGNVNLYQTASGRLQLDSSASDLNLVVNSSQTTGYIYIRENNSNRFFAGYDATNGYVQAGASRNLVLQSGAATFLTGDTSQNATFAGTIKSSGFTRVTADATNATATMASISDLSVTVAAGVHYTGTIQVFAKDSTGADGLAFDLAGGSCTFTDLEFGFAAQPTGSTLGTVTSTTSTTPITLTVVSTSDAVYAISFGFTCNAAGTFIPRYAQNSHSAGTATIRKNSGEALVVSAN